MFAALTFIVASTRTPDPTPDSASMTPQKQLSPLSIAIPEDDVTEIVSATASALVVTSVATNTAIGHEHTTPEEKQPEQKQIETPHAVSIQPMDTQFIELIRDMGRQYLLKYPQSIVNALQPHQNQPIATALMNYTPVNATLEMHRTFLMSRYLELINFNGELSKTIRDFFKTHFQAELTPDYLIRNLSLDTVKEVGLDYLRLYPEAMPKPSGWSGIFQAQHHNHAHARTLANTTADTAYELWTVLLDTYGQLPKTDGTIATRIERIVTNAFGITFDKVDNSGWISQHRTTAAIATKVKENIADKLYATCRGFQPI
jgi:hypothetical protein